MNVYVRKTLFIVIMFVFASGFCLFGCGGGDGDEGDGYGSLPQKKWTVMLYLDGDNNEMQHDFLIAFQEMIQAGVGSNDEVNIVAQFDRYPGDSAYGGWEIAHRFFITQGMEPTEENAIKNWGDGGGGREVDMSEPDTLKDFITWSVSNYPAERYALIPADHGFGWEGLLIDDTNYKRTMSIKQLRQALKDSQVHIDLLSLDACTMQMIEVAYELKDAGADIMVGSENTGTTWPFADIINDLTDDPYISTEEFGKIIVNAYNKYHEGQPGITLSELKLSNIKMLEEAVRELAVAILNESPFPLIQEKATVVTEQIQNTVLYVKNSPDWESAQGVSVYFSAVGGIGTTMPPELQYFYKSEVVSFAEDALWHNLLASLYTFTHEPPPTASKIIQIRFHMDTFDDDKIDLYDFCKRIVDYEE
jgi:hypothetical protein